MINGDGSFLERGTMVCHCLLIETDQGLCLVDTGLGMGEMTDAAGRLGKMFLLMTAPRLDPEETALRQVARLGFKAEDVRHIVVTHLDLDHAGGLPDFPRARVHVYGDEYDAAMGGATLMERNRYRRVHWAHGPLWSRCATGGEPWFGFDCVRQLEGLPPEILMVPLQGHTRGHCAIAVETGAAQGARGAGSTERAGARWLVHAGDAYFCHGEMDPEGRRCTPGLDAFQRIVEVDGAARRKNQERLRILARDHAAEVAVFCAHDLVELTRHQASAS
jgi:glyoxylase-like metal-dependent hydrolase (beta-lactamase superfamily II)